MIKDLFIRQKQFFSNISLKKKFMSIIIALLWYSYWHFFFIHGMGPSFFNWEPDELPIITL